MKLVRFESFRGPALGVVQGGNVVDLALASGSTERFPASMAAFLGRGEDGFNDVKSVASSAPANALLALSSTKLLAPVSDPPKIICIGQNYRDHCIEQNQPIPERVIIFSKYATAVNDPGGNIVLPKASEQVDYEAELVFVIGKTGKHIPESEAMDYVAGYTCANDVSARDIQFADKQWVRGKSPDTFLPIGPYLVTADDIGDPHDLNISLTLNGQTMQNSNTSNLIFKIPYLISFLSSTMTLLPGDIVSTGTPGGVGIFRNPPIVLKGGDSVSVTVQGLGTLTNPVIAE